MPFTVLVVDDSLFFRQQIRGIINAHPELKVIGEANNGREAIDKTLKLKPDVITMDYEMPLMDGITAVREIMAKQPTPILMFSSLTQAGARITLDALEAGAVDYLPKGYENVANQQSSLRKQLIEKILAVVHTNKKAKAPPRPRPAASVRPVSKKPDIVLIGTSTGGPVALQKVLTKLPAEFAAPLLLIQHMPAAFTGAFAQRLDKQCKIKVAEARDGDSFSRGEAYLAPGGKQMMLSSKNKLKIIPGDDRLNYKPCVDVTFGSAAKYYRGNALAIVLTGMGADGREGARLLKQGGSAVWAQEGRTCTIDGMPSAIVKADLADDIVPLDKIAENLTALFR